MDGRFNVSRDDVRALLLPALRRPLLTAWGLTFIILFRDISMSILLYTPATIPSSVSLLAIWFFGFNLWGLGLALVVFFINLFLTGWAVAILDVSGAVVWSAEGEGFPSARLEWNGVTMAGTLAPADHERAKAELKLLMPEDAKEAELEIYRTQAADKPADVQQKIAEGKLRKWFEEVVLLNQPYFRDEDQTVEQVRAALSSEMGENIEIKRFASYTLGQDQ